jgi:recombination protein RecT
MRTDGSDRNQRGSKGAEKTEQQERQDTLVDEIAKMSREFSRALPKEITTERMMRIVMTAIRSNPKLAECTAHSFYGAMLTALQLGLEVNTPLEHAFLIPRWNNSAKMLQCHFELGYKGLIELCYRTNLYKRIESEVVYEGDKFNYEYGFESFLRHKPCGNLGEPIYVWALYELINGGKSFKVWTWEQVMNHAAAFSESFDPESTWKSPWLANPTSQKGMAKKTVLHDALNYAPKSVELARGLNADGNVVISKAGDDADGFSYEIFGEGGEPLPQDRKKEEKEGRREEKREREQIPPPDDRLKAPPQRPPERRADSAPAGGFNGGAPGKRTGGLFPREQEDALEEQYRREREAGLGLPEFPE